MLIPNIPTNVFTESGIELFSIPLICFAPSVEKCIKALGIKICSSDKVLTNYEEYEIWFIHEPVNYDDLQIISNEEIVKNKYVPDAINTGEL